MTKTINSKIIIIGAGFSGLCVAIKLKQNGIHDFIIIDKAEGLGGTWRENTYPGAECDIPSALYSYSFEHNSEWEFKWSGQAQILKYQQDTADKYGLMKHMRFKRSVCSAIYNEEQQSWAVSTDQDEVFQAQHLISAVGQLHFPFIPEFENADQFSGAQFHSAQWNHRIDLTGKRVGVVGNAASAIQFIPEIAKYAEQVHVYQRSANWVLPKLDRPYAKWEQKLSSDFPLVTKMYRWFVWAVGEYGVLSAIKGNRLARWVFTKIALKTIKKKINDPALQSKLTPDYDIGAKRILFSDHYYDALSSNNVELVTQELKQFVASGVKRIDNSVDELDVVIYATGFKTNPFLLGLDIQGEGGNRIHDAWSDGAHAYLGIMTAGFPNLFMMFGPNTNLGHTSVVLMFEAQADYIVEQITFLEKQGYNSCSVKQSVEKKYNQELQSRLSDMAFNKVSNSWYKDGEKITNNWAGGTKEYQRLLSKVDWTAYHLN